MRKFLFFFLSLLLFSIPSSAQDTIGAVAKDNFYEISDFSGGLNSHISPYQIKKNAASVSQNVRFNERLGSLVKRPKMLELSACRAFPVKSLYRYYKSDATKYTIQTSSTFIDSVADGTGTCTNLMTGMSDSKHWTWTTYKDIAIGTNGTDRPKKWDGKTLSTANTDAARTAGDLITDLGASFAELNTGSNLTASKWYQYRVAFYDGSTYKYSNARSNPILTGTSVQDIYLTDIPLGPSGTTSRIIYRTTGNSSRANVLADTAFKRVATISDNTTRVFADTVTDATLAGDSAPTWATVSAGINASPPYTKFSVIHKEKLFMSNDPSGTISGKSTIYWSDNFNPDYFNTATDYELIRPDDGDQITVIKNVLGGLIIGKEASWSKIYTDAETSADWTISAPFSFIGCIAPYSAVNTNSGIVYLGRHGLYIMNGQSSELISDVVTDKIEDILATNQGEVVSIYHNNQYLMAYTSLESGESQNNRVLILDITRNAYAEDTKDIDSWATFESGTDFGTLYSGSSTTSGKVYAHSGTFDDLIYRYKSQFDSGTPAAVYISGTEDEPLLTLGWDNTWATAPSTWASQGSATWIVENSTGTWVSPAIQIEANALDKIYWNENLGSTGNITFAIRLATTEAGLSAASYSSEFSDPSGSDISGLTANTWVQIRATLTSTDYVSTPELYLEDNSVFHMQYQREGTSGESSILSVWKSGFTDLGSGENPNRIKEVQVFYEGTVGTLNISLENDQGIVYGFDINLAISPNASTTDQYYGNSIENIYTYFPSVTDSMVGRKWRITVTENGVTEFKVNRIVLRTDVNAYVPFK